MIRAEKIADGRVPLPARSGHISENRGTVLEKGRRGRVYPAVFRTRQGESGRRPISCVRFPLYHLVLTYGIPSEFRGGVHLFVLNRNTPSGQSRVYRVTQLRTDGVHCREFAGTGPVNLKVVSNECCLGRSSSINMRLSFAHPLVV